MLLQVDLPEWLQSFLDGIWAWFEATFPQLAELADTIWGYVGIVILLIIPGVGAGVAFIFFLLLSFSGPIDPSGGFPILILFIVAFAICVALIVFTAGTTTPLWGANAVVLLLVIMVFWSKMETTSAIISGIILTTVFTLGIIGRRKTKRKIPPICLSVGDREMCLFKKINGD